MTRKDCEIRKGRRAALIFAAMVAGMALSVRAGQLRVWSSAVVISDSIKLGDLVEFRDVDSEESDVLRELVVTDAPPQGGSRIIHHEMIRAALVAKGVNLSQISLKGAAQCEVRRPAALQSDAPSPMDAKLHVGAANGNAQPEQAAPPAAVGSGRTLRDAIVSHFDGELARFGGKAEVLFDGKDDQVLALTGPPLEFKIQPEKKAALGLTALEVQIIKGGELAQTLRLVVRTALSRHVVTARRAINQGATIVATDVELVSVTFTHLDDLGVEDESIVLGQRAKKFIPAGTAIDPDSLEPVPLVLRGQLITLISEVGGVRIVTTAKACAAGKRGEMIRVRSVDDHKVELDAIVIGPGEARALGATDSREESKPRLVLGGKP